MLARSVAFSLKLNVPGFTGTHCSRSGSPGTGF